MMICYSFIISSEKQCKYTFFFQENYDRMKVLVDELKTRTEKIKLGRCEHTTDYILHYSHNVF